MLKEAIQELGEGLEYITHEYISELHKRKSAGSNRAEENKRKRLYKVGNKC